MGIGGNRIAEIQVKDVTSSAIGEHLENWRTVCRVRGWLDLSAAYNAKTYNATTYDRYNAKIQESTHVFLCGGFGAESLPESENVRLWVDGRVYEVVLVDDPMGLHRQLEIYLKYIGGQSDAGQT